MTQLLGLSFLTCRKWAVTPAFVVTYELQGLVKEQTPWERWCSHPELHPWAGLIPSRPRFPHLRSAGVHSYFSRGWVEGDRTACLEALEVVVVGCFWASVPLVGSLGQAPLPGLPSQHCHFRLCDL